jgi:hypothetical protein
MIKTIIRDDEHKSAVKISRRYSELDAIISYRYAVVAGRAGGHVRKRLITPMWSVSWLLTASSLAMSAMGAKGYTLRPSVRKRLAR